VEVTIPVEQSKNDELVNGISNDLPNVTSDSEECMKSLPQRAAGKFITFTRGKAPSSHEKDIAWSCIQKYCTEWFGFEHKDTTADLIITDEENTTTKYLDGQRILIIHDDMSCATKQEDKHYRHAIGKICNPIGPFKLARSILALLDQEIIMPEETQKSTRQIDVGTQTPLGSPEERTVMNEIILTDYGFTPSLPSIPDAININEAKPTRTTATSAWNKQQQSAADHVFASLSALSIQPTPLQHSSTDTPSPIFPFFTPPEMTLTLPQPKALTPPPSTTTNPPSDGLHILAVDDNAVNLQLLHRYLLKRVGDTTVTARNGLEAVEAVKSLPKGDGFDVIFMDISMPEMDGFEATRLIRSYEISQSVEMDEEIDGRGISPANEKKNERENGVRKRERSYIVALTGLASRRDRDLAEECGFDDFLTKPISFKKIGGLLEGISGVVTG
jgi:CheY-like chemotaxis protein